MVQRRVRRSRGKGECYLSRGTQFLVAAGDLDGDSGHRDRAGTRPRARDGGERVCEMGGRVARGVEAVGLFRAQGEIVFRPVLKDVVEFADVLTVALEDPEKM
jgi:hypothetical protein